MAEQIIEDPAEVIIATEVAEILKCSKSQVYRMRDSGVLHPRFKLFGGQKGWRWLRADVNECLSRCAIEPFAPVDLSQQSVRGKMGHADHRTPSLKSGEVQSHGVSR